LAFLLLLRCINHTQLRQRKTSSSFFLLHKSPSLPLFFPNIPLLYPSALLLIPYNFHLTFIYLSSQPLFTKLCSEFQRTSNLLFISVFSQSQENKNLKII
jgi:hypothetical protein